MREETNSWYQRLITGQSTPHATAKDGHRNLVLTMAMDASAFTGEAIDLTDNLESHILEIQSSVKTKGQ